MAALVSHRILLDDEGRAWVGEQDVVVANLDNPLAEAAGRAVITNASQLWDAADADAGDLEALVGSLVTGHEPGELWQPDVLRLWPEAIVTDALIMLRGVNVTPILRGHRLGAWTAAQSVAIFDHGQSLVALKAAPLALRDVLSEAVAHERHLTDHESKLWRAEQVRLAQQWHAQLGMQPLASDSTVLTWHTSYINLAIKETLRHWAAV